MLEKVQVLRIGLGLKHNGIKLRDVQLWRDEQTMNNGNQGEKEITLKGEFISYIDLRKVPLWLMLPATMKEKNFCFTNSTTTLAYFNSKLRYRHRGIIIELADGNGDDKFIVMYKDQNNVRWFCFNIKLKENIDAQIREKYKLNDDGDDKKKGIDTAIRQSQESKLNIRRNADSIKKKVHFNEVVTKLILGGLRLRGVPNTNSGFHKLYKMTFQATEFAHRDDHDTVPFEELQETVETLLKLFTKS
ncbi:hypothetical protein NCAS_0G00500 [Naumovozyma castellii]|uniref:Mitochondrial morphogenesis protein SLD7 n=1 Tax=Naumovozyma castellii TaxID=27288 RepID=G0VHQ3_NAUCA|nr:hypothetical protein NCAS_0G00500 [Naumovozyma castellii CBS 4309]CCC70937.1 hypothetical protein NCAS_0G00500 [Naumovozyma castellii CBS 4309]